MSTVDQPLMVSNRKSPMDFARLSGAITSKSCPLLQHRHTPKERQYHNHDAILTKLLVQESNDPADHTRIIYKGDFAVAGDYYAIVKEFTHHSLETASYAYWEASHEAPTKIVVYVDGVPTELEYEPIAIESVETHKKFLQNVKFRPRATAIRKASTSVKKPGTSTPRRQILQAELISYQQEEAYCWIEISQGLRIRVAIPASYIKDFEFMPGARFLWNVTDKVALAVPENVESPERTRIRRSLDELSREFHDELKHRKVNSDDE